MDRVRLPCDERFVTLSRMSRIFTDLSVKFILLHDTKNDDGIRQFFIDLWELYVKAGR